MLKLTSLGSGSKGNCTLIDNGRNKVLIDAGLSFRTIIKKLKDLSIGIDDIDALLITHEHDDHVKAMPEIMRTVPVYSHPDTLANLSDRYLLPFKNQMEVEEQVFSVGTLDVLPFRTSHDAIHPYGFVINDCDSKLCYITDTGFISKGTMALIKGSDTVMIESNHDKELLMLGAYPYPLKRRIMSELGHLCNEECALTISSLIENGAKKVMLAHLSEKNNLPELAYWTTANYLRRLGIQDGDYTLKIADQRQTVILG